jgi:hypothetical protein
MPPYLLYCASTQHLRGSRRFVIEVGLRTHFNYGVWMLLDFMAAFCERSAFGTRGAVFLK